MQHDCFQCFGRMSGCLAAASNQKHTRLLLIISTSLISSLLFAYLLRWLDFQLISFSISGKMMNSLLFSSVSRWCMHQDGALVCRLLFVVCHWFWCSGWSSILKFMLTHFTAPFVDRLCFPYRTSIGFYGRQLQWRRRTVRQQFPTSWTNPASHPSRPSAIRYWIIGWYCSAFTVATAAVSARTRPAVCSRKPEEETVQEVEEHSARGD